jgi:hypothetical protein
LKRETQAHDSTKVSGKLCGPWKRVSLSNWT